MSNIDQMIENVRIARLHVRNLTEQLKAAGVIVQDYDYTVDPTTGQVMNLKIIIIDGFKPEEFEAALAKLNMAHVSFGIGFMLRNLPRDPEALAFKLHDFGYRNGQ